MSQKYMLILECNSRLSYKKSAKEELMLELEKLGVKTSDICEFESGKLQESREMISKWYLDPMVRKIYLLEMYQVLSEKEQKEKVVFLPLPYSVENTVGMAKNMGGRRNGVFVYIGSEKNGIQLEFAEYKDKLEAYLMKTNGDYMNKAADWLVFKTETKPHFLKNRKSRIPLLMLLVLFLIMIFYRMHFAGLASTIPV